MKVCVCSWGSGGGGGGGGGSVARNQTPRSEPFATRVGVQGSLGLRPLMLQHVGERHTRDAEARERKTVMGDARRGRESEREGEGKSNGGGGDQLCLLYWFVVGVVGQHAQR